MNKFLSLVGAFAVTTLSLPAALILNEPFAYPDGSIAGPGNVSGDEWITHSGTTGQVDVASEVVSLSQSESEDVSRLLPGGPYSSGTLYASFKINLSTLPGGNGTYFFHYRDTGTINFRARVFLTSTNAGPGTFRVGITAGGNAPTLIPVDLSLATEYKLVVRYNAAAPAATLWINPTSEDAVTSRADSTDTTSAVAIHFVCLRQAGASPGMGVLTFDDLLVGTEFSDVQTVGGPPSISGLVDVSIPANTSTGPMPFLVSDVETPAENLTVTATSDNPALVPNNPANLTLGGSGANRTLNVTPAAGQQGAAEISVVVTDGNNETATNSFVVRVGVPTISAVANQVTATNTPTAPIAFTVNDTETPAGNLVVTATSSDQNVVPDGNIAFGGSGSSRTVAITPNADTAGWTTITLTVNDGTWNISTSFVLTVYPKIGIILADEFDYPDGSITENSGFLWTTHSAATGQTGQTQVVNGKLLLNNTASEDINRWYNVVPITSTSGVLLHSRFIVSFSALPTASGVGEYFAHFREASGGNFRARVFATTNGAPAGKFRMAISNGGFVTAVHPAELSLDTSYVIIIRYNTATAESTLWVNPSSENSPSVAATDQWPPITAYSYAFRQQTGIGSLSVDDLAIGGEFADVLVTTTPLPEPLEIQRIGGDIVLTWSDPAFKLFSASSVNGSYTEVVGASSPHTVPISGPQQFFQLRHSLQ